jgi:uncharacterized membrane protein YhaH (DUF805 family)
MSTCLTSFITTLLTDLGYTTATINDVLAHAANGIAAYVALAPTESIATFVNQLYTCAQRSTNRGFRAAIEAVLAATVYASFLLITFVVIIELVELQGRDRLVLIIVMLIIYAVLVYIGVSILTSTLNTILGQTEKEISVCINTVTTNLTNLAAQEKAAINAGLCGYGP